jgi:hypothetical protein
VNRSTPPSNVALPAQAELGSAVAATKLASAIRSRVLMARSVGDAP